jgi:uncharacterized protein YggE
MFNFKLYHPAAIFTVFLLNLMLMCPVQADPTETTSLRTIHVNGTGKTMVKPDNADISLSVEIQAKTAEAARNQAAKTMSNLIDTVTALGIDEKDIQTRSVSLYPNYAPDTANKIVGYQLANQILIHVRDIDKASNVIDTAVSEGGNAVRLQNLSFGIEAPASALGIAREKAFADAKAKAEQYAKMANLSLGAPLHISEGSEIPHVPMPYAEMRTMKSAVMDSAPTPVQAGEQEVNVTVDIVFSVNP